LKSCNYFPNESAEPAEPSSSVLTSAPAQK
jgi:hypothetical protein